MRSTFHWHWPQGLRLSPATTRALAIIAALGVLALTIGACSLTAGSPAGTASGGLSSNTGSVTTGNGQSTSVKILRGGGGTAMVLVPVTIDGHGPYDFALDTGAGITLIDTELADNLRLPVTGDSAQVSGVGGTQQVTPVHITTWNAGKISLPAADVGKTSLSSFKRESNVRGLLGSDILSRFGRITINYDTAQLSTWIAPASHALATPASALLAETTDAWKEARRPQAA